MSPSLRGSGLKSWWLIDAGSVKKSPSLRGSGLKWTTHDLHSIAMSKSPSLRGSGLKFFCCNALSNKIKCLPLYEGVDWNRISATFSAFSRVSPSLRGSGLKSNRTKQPNQTAAESPSLRGSGLKLLGGRGVGFPPEVSLFTREWIEIIIHLSMLHPSGMSPSLRGSGLKLHGSAGHPVRHPSPSLRGSGLKSEEIQ